MPSPFPGMDPYLEDPVLWPGVHQRLITYISGTLNAQLPTQYVTDIGERLYIVHPEHPIYPDIVIFEIPQPPTSVATVVSDPPWILIVEPVEVREAYINILSLNEAERVITTIEVLSYTNKASNSPGRRMYLTKQQELLDSAVHLIEIDLLRNTEYTLAPPRSELDRRGAWDYLVSLHRGGAGERYEVWHATVRQHLPRLRVPLAEPDPDVVLDLQSVFERCYDIGNFVRRINYRHPPATPLSPADAE